MMASTANPTVSTTPPVPGLAPAFPQDLTAWVEQARLLHAVQASATRACGNSWLDLVRTDAPPAPPDDLLVLVGYCYLQGVYHSIDVLRRLDLDPELEALRPRLALRTEQVRRFRREHRRSLTDCLTHTLVGLWRERAPLSQPPLVPGQLLPHRIDFDFLEPFYLQAQDRIDRAVVLDSMALDD